MSESSNLLTLKSKQTVSIVAPQTCVKFQTLAKSARNRLGTIVLTLKRERLGADIDVVVQPDVGERRAPDSQVAKLLRGRNRGESTLSYIRPGLELAEQKKTQTVD